MTEAGTEKAPEELLERVAVTAAEKEREPLAEDVEVWLQLALTLLVTTLLPL